MEREETSLVEVIDYFGYGSFSLKLTGVVGFLWFLDGIEITLISLLAPELKCKWNLTSFQAAMTSASVFMGMASGAIFWGKLADKFGRKPFSILGTAVVFYFGLLTTMTSNFAWFMAMRFFVGIGLGNVILSPIYVSELISRRYQGKVMLGIQFFFAFGNFYVAFLAYAVMNRLGWRVFVLLAATPIAFTFPLFIWLPESVHYLENIRAVDKIMKVLRVISLEHKMPVPKNIVFRKRVKDRGSLSKVFVIKDRVNNLLLIFLFVFVMVTYFGVVLLNTELEEKSGYHKETGTCHTLTDREYLQNVIVVFGEVPGLLVFMLVVDKVSHKTAFLSAFAIISVGLLVLWKFGTSIYVRTFVMFILRGTATSSLQIVWLYSAASCPTSYRATLLGLCSGTGRWALIFAPLLVQYLVHVSFTGTIFVFIAISMLSSAIILIREKNVALQKS